MIAPTQPVHRHRIGHGFTIEHLLRRVPLPTGEAVTHPGINRRDSVTAFQVAIHDGVHSVFPAWIVRPVEPHHGLFSLHPGKHRVVRRQHLIQPDVPFALGYCRNIDRLQTIGAV